MSKEIDEYIMYEEKKETSTWPRESSGEEGAEYSIFHKGEHRRHEISNIVAAKQRERVDDKGETKIVNNKYNKPNFHFPCLYRYRNLILIPLICGFCYGFGTAFGNKIIQNIRDHTFKQNFISFYKYIWTLIISLF